MEEYSKAVTCQLCSQPYTDPRTLSCLHSFCQECLIKELERQSVSFKMERSQHDSSVEKGSQCDGSEEKSQLQVDDSEKGCLLDGAEEGSQDGGLEDGSQDGGLEDGSQDGGLEDRSQDGGLEDGSQDGGLEDESQDGGLEDGCQDNNAEEGSQDGGLEDGCQDNNSEEESHSDEEFHSEKKVQQSLKCPTCKIPAFIPKGGVSELPQNFHLGFEAKVAQYQLKISRAHEVPCDACIGGSSGPSVGFCCQCFQFLCQSCSEYHKRNRILHCHIVVTLGTEVRREQFHDKLPVPSCSLHGNEKLTLYCAACKCLICQECTTTDAHKDHIESIEIPQKSASSERDEIKKGIACVQKRMQELNAAVDANREVLQQVEASGEEAAVAIRKAFGKLHSVIEEREKQLQSELNDLVLCKTTRIGLQNEKWGKLIQDAGRYLEFASKLFQNGTDHELIAMKQLPSTQLEAVFRRVNSEHLVPCEHGDVTVAMETGPVCNELLNFGKIIDSRPYPEESIWVPESSAIVNEVFMLRVTARDFQGQPYPHRGIDIDVRAELRPNAIGQTLTFHGKFEKDMDGTYTITLTPQTVGPHQLHVTMDGQHIKNSPYDLEVRKSKLDYSADLGNPVLNISVTSPLSIAIHKDSGDIYVGSEDCVFVFSKDGIKKSSIGSAGNGLCQFNRPRGLAIKGDVLYVADCNNHRIQKLDLRGTFAYAFGKHGKKDGEFNYPIAILVDFNDRLIVADQGNHRIQVMTLDGTFLMSIHKINSPKLDFSNICGIALDVQGNIHVVKRYNNSGWINVFTPGGTFIAKYRTVVKPTAIGIDVEGYTLVCDAETKSVHVYDVTGQECGMAVENVGNPKGIVLDNVAVYIVCTPNQLYLGQRTTGYLQKYSLHHSSTSMMIT